LARYSEIDALNADSLVLSMTTCPDLTPIECSMFDRSTTPGDDTWRRIKGTVAEAVSYFQTVGDSAGQLGWGLGSRERNDRRVRHRRV